MSHDEEARHDEITASRLEGMFNVLAGPNNLNEQVL